MQNLRFTPSKYGMISSLSLLTFLLTTAHVSGFTVQNDSASCNSPKQVLLGNKAEIICYFDANYTHRIQNVFLEHFNPETYLQEVPVLCKISAGTFKCKSIKGYTVIGNVTEKLSVEIQPVVQKHAGIYRCGGFQPDPYQRSVCDIKVIDALAQPCTNSPPAEGEEAYLKFTSPTCLKSLKVSYIPQNSSKCTDVLTCEMIGGKSSCQDHSDIKYQFVNCSKGSLFIKIPHASKQCEGIYNLSIVQEIEVVTCKLTLSERKLDTVSTTLFTLMKYKGARAEEENGVDFVSTVVILILVAILFILLIAIVFVCHLSKCRRCLPFDKNPKSESQESLVTDLLDKNSKTVCQEI